MPEENPTASVFVPVRNEEEHIKECLNSLVNQDYPNDKYEIVIVDGKSEDQTREIIKKFMKKHAHIRLIENPELNVSAGRRIGVEESRGKYVIAFSGHSYAEPDFIRKLVTRLEKAEDDIAGVGCRHETPQETLLQLGRLGSPCQVLLGVRARPSSIQRRSRLWIQLPSPPTERKSLTRLEALQTLIWSGRETTRN